MVKIEIEIPDPPEGWVFDGYRKAVAGEMVLFDNRQWSKCQCSETYYSYLVAVKAKPLWEPSPELVAVLRPGWIAKNENTTEILHFCKPVRMPRGWASEGNQYYLHCVRPELLPPTSIPWDQSCFKIGEPE